MRNITIDDTDPSIVYSGTWDSTSDTQNPLAYDGAHHVSFGANATATWHFTGVAFYYIAPMWAYPVNTLIKIDNGNVTHNVDLDNHSLPQTKSGLQESIGWSVLWGSGELENTLHTIVASRPPGGPQYVVVDAFMYTVLDPDGLPISPAKSPSSVIIPLVASLVVPAILILTATLICWLRRGCNRRGKRAAAAAQPVQARYSIEMSLQFTPAIRPSSTPQNSACLLCRSSPKEHEFDFCGITCRDAMRNLAPMVLEVPRGHVIFTMIENKFRQSWRAGSTPCPQVQNVYRVIVDSASVQAYDNYLWTHGNESFRYHGTSVATARRGAASARLQRLLDNFGFGTKPNRLKGNGYG